MRTRKRNNILMMTLVCVTVLGLGIGFAAFASNLTIKSTAQVNPDSSDFSVVFSTAAGSNSYGAVAASPASMGEPATISESDPTTISGLKAKFTAPEQSVSYTFYARNTGEYLAYLNYITIGDKTCTAGDGTNADMVASACNGISISVKVGSDSAVSASTGLMSTHTLAAGSNEQVVVTISYAKDSALADGPFSVEFGDVKLTYSTISNYVKPVETICTYVNNGVEELTVGAQYSCEVDPTTNAYTFYVLKTPSSSDTSVNLIMDSNINISGEAIKSNEITDKGLVAWNESGIYSEGPITAMDYLVEATKNWSNLDEMTINDFRIDANNEVVKISKSYSTYARLPHDSEMPSGNATFLYEYLDEYPSEMWPQGFAQPTKFVSGIEGYWTDTINSSSIIEDTPIAYGAALVGYLSTNEITNAISFGVRPVITVSMDQIS